MTLTAGRDILRSSRYHLRLETLCTKRVDFLQLTVDVTSVKANLIISPVIFITHQLMALGLKQANCVCIWLTKPQW